MKKLVQSFRFALNGFIKNIPTERNLQIHLVTFLFVLALGFYFSISQFEWLTIFLISALVISLELINSAIEKLCDFVQPDLHEKIKIIKDTAAAAVLVAAGIALVVGGIIFLPKIL
ncbi:MAG: diacylglycerol kinase family protein [Crocinitomicaceae bacterium]